MYPVMLNLRERPCLVVGGGGVALRKVIGLVEEGARVTVIAQQACQPLLDRSADGVLRLEQRSYRDGEAGEYSLAFAATDEPDVNARVASDAEAAGVWVNVADQARLCGFHLPGRIRRGPLAIAVGSSGRAPFAVRRLRQRLERLMGPEWAEWADVAGRFRDALRRLPLSERERDRRFDHFFEATVRMEGRFTARVPTTCEVDSWFASPERGPALSLAPRPLRVATSGRGLVSLVGAGPGDPRLLTVRGLQRLMVADAVVYDRLAAPALPANLPSRVTLHCVAKSAGRHPVPQPAITELLIRLAGEDKRVVRLKGGDPFVFGRGGEETEALAAAGVPFEVVPGVSAAMGAGACAGIPLTHREDASTLVFVTAHQARESAGPRVDWERLAALEGTTLVGYMGLRGLPRVVGRLLAAGMDPSTPAAVVSWASTAAQRLVRGPLSDLPSAVAAAGVETPAIFFIGPVAARSLRLDWFARRLLTGLRLAVPTPAGPLLDALELLGAQVIEVPLPLTPAARIALGSLPLHGWLLRRSEQVELLDGEQVGLGGAEPRVAWCLGATVAERARAMGSCDVVELSVDVSVEQLSAAIGAAPWARGSLPRGDTLHPRRAMTGA